MSSDVHSSEPRHDDGVTGVAFLCHPYHRGGVTRWMVDAAAEFQRRGTPTWFIAPQPRRPFPSGARRPTMLSLLEALPAEQRPRIVAPRVGVEFELGTVPYRASVYARAVARSVPPGTPCIVSDDPSVWAGASAHADLYPMVGVLHGDDVAYYSLAAAYHRQLSRCIAVSKRIAGRARSEAGVPAVVIPCGIPLRPLPSGRASTGDARLLWVGRMEEEFKRVSDLPRIAAALRDRGVAFHLDIVGDGSAENDLRRTISDMGLDSMVSLRGWRTADEVWSLMGQSDVMLLPSNREGMPVVLMEALAAGCAAVASRISGVEDLLELPGSTSVLRGHDVGDVVAAADLVEVVLRSPHEERRQRARALAEDAFAISHCVDAYARELALATPQAVRDASVVRSRHVASALSAPLALVRAARRSLGMVSES